MGEHPALWHFMERLMGETDHRGMGARAFSREERGLRWSELVARAAAAGGDLPVAVFRLRRDITIKELLDADTALDHFILELFEAYGQEGRLGQEGPSVLVNPGDGVDLTGYDGLVFLRLGRRAVAAADASAAPAAPAAGDAAGGGV
jgi:voltage-gated potassium channel